MLTLRGSSYGGCIHSHICAMRGVEEAPPPSHMQAIFDRGNAAEEWAKNQLERKGVKWKQRASGLANQDAQKLALFFDAPPDASGQPRLIFLSITPDGLAEGKNGKLKSVEMKSFSRKAYEEFRQLGISGNERYAYQVSAEVHGYRRELRQHVSGVLVPIIAENVPGDEKWNFELGDIVEFEEPPFTLQQIEQRCLRIVEAFDKGEWHKCDSKYPCRYPHQEGDLAQASEEAMLNDYIKTMERFKMFQVELDAHIAGGDSIAGRRMQRVTLPAWEVAQ